MPGTDPRGINPLTVRTLEDAGLPTKGLSSKSVEEFLGQKFDYVITVCDNARQSCPGLPGQPPGLPLGLRRSGRGDRHGRGADGRLPRRLHPARPAHQRVRGHRPTRRQRGARYHQLTSWKTVQPRPISSSTCCATLMPATRPNGRVTTPNGRSARRVAARPSDSGSSWPSAASRPIRSSPAPSFARARRRRSLPTPLGLAVTVDDRLASSFDVDTCRCHRRGRRRDVDRARRPRSGLQRDCRRAHRRGVPAAQEGARIVRIDVALPLQHGSGILRWLVPPDLLIEQDLTRARARGSPGRRRCRLRHRHSGRRDRRADHPHRPDPRLPQPASRRRPAPPRRTASTPRSRWSPASALTAVIGPLIGPLRLVGGAGPDRHRRARPVVAPLGARPDRGRRDHERLHQPHHRTYAELLGLTLLNPATVIYFGALTDRPALPRRRRQSGSSSPRQPSWRPSRGRRCWPRSARRSDAAQATGCTARRWSSATSSSSASAS